MRNAGPRAILVLGLAVAGLVLPDAARAHSGAWLAPAPTSADVVEALPSGLQRGDVVTVRGGPTVQPADRTASVTFYREWYLPIQPPEIGWTGSYTPCSGGSVSAAYKAAIARRVNYFRAMAGVPADIVMDDAVSLGNQQDAALMMSANDALVHNPPSNWQCYTTAGYHAAATSQLALGDSGPPAMDLYMQEGGDNNFAAGHRRWLLFPQTLAMATGDTPPGNGHMPANALRAADAHYIDPRPPVRDGFVAWPPPGYVPHTVVYARWSLSFPGANFNGAQVAMRRNGAVVSLRREPVDTGYADNTVVWVPLGLGTWDPWPTPASDETYDVSVTGVALNGATVAYNYRVIVMRAPDAVTDLVLTTNHVAENRPAGTAVGTVAATDGALGPGYAVTLVPGAEDNALFALSGQTLLTAATFNFEARSAYSVRVRAQNSSGSILERSLAVAVDNVNEPPGLPALMNGSIAENQPPDTAAGVVTAVDPDAGDRLTFRLASGSGDRDNARFRLDGVTLRANTTLDYEARPTYTVRLEVLDQGGLSAAAAVEVRVINLDEPPAIMAPSSVFITPSASISLTVRAVDPERAGATLSATTLPPWVQAQRVNASTLVFRGIGASATGAYQLGMHAQDANGNTTDQTMTFRVSNIVARNFLPAVNFAP